MKSKRPGAAPGTTIEVRQIFFNLPARRKFLRTEETESAHVQHYLTLAALAFPEVAFTFQKDGRVVWQLPAVKSGADIPARLAALRERLRALYGSEPKLLPVDFTRRELSDRTSSRRSASPDFPQSRIINHKSKISRLGFHRRARRVAIDAGGPASFVNRRPVENRGLNFALLEGYHTALMKGRYPVCCLFLEIDPGRGGREHSSGQTRSEVSSRRRRAAIGGAGGARRRCLNFIPRQTQAAGRRAEINPPSQRAVPVQWSQRLVPPRWQSRPRRSTSRRRSRNSPRRRPSVPGSPPPEQRSAQNGIRPARPMPLTPSHDATPAAHIATLRHPIGNPPSRFRSSTSRSASSA